MGENTAIEWADHTFNPWIGCQKVSAACDHCYAETWAERFGQVEWGPKAERKRTSRHNWAKPVKWNNWCAKNGQRKRVFCASLADVFDNRAPEGARDDLWSLIRSTRSLDWLLLTKRPQNIAGMLPGDWGSAGYENVWLGTTVENQEEAERRIPHLLSVPAPVHFLSCEPLLGPVDLTDVWSHRPIDEFDPGHHWDVLDERHIGMDEYGLIEPVDWVICGGESGPVARPTHMFWARELRDQCQAAAVPFFFKQWGEWLPGAQYQAHHLEADPGELSRYPCLDWDDGELGSADGLLGNEMSGEEVFRVGKRAAGRMLDGRTWDQMPGDEMPTDRGPGQAPDRSHTTKSGKSP